MKTGDGLDPRMVERDGMENAFNKKNAIPGLYLLVGVHPAFAFVDEPFHRPLPAEIRLLPVLLRLAYETFPPAGLLRIYVETDSRHDLGSSGDVIRRLLIAAADFA